jgi:single-stranded DNA-binding protein
VSFSSPQSRVYIFRRAACGWAENIGRHAIMAYYVGFLHYSTWEDRDRNARYGCEIIADRIDFF